MTGAALRSHAFATRREGVCRCERFHRLLPWSLRKLLVELSSPIQFEVNLTHTQMLFQPIGHLSALSSVVQAFVSSVGTQRQALPT